MSLQLPNDIIQSLVGVRTVRKKPDFNLAPDLELFRFGSINSQVFAGQLKLKKNNSRKYRNEVELRQGLTPSPL